MSYKTTELTSTLTMNNLTSLSPSSNDFLVGGSSALTTGTRVPTPTPNLLYYWQGYQGGTGSNYYYKISNGRNRFTWRQIGGLPSSLGFKDPEGNTYSDTFHYSSYVTPQSRDSSSTPPSVATNNWHMGFTLTEGVYYLNARISTRFLDNTGWIECAWHDQNDNIVGPRQIMSEGSSYTESHTDRVIAIVTVGSSGNTYGIKATAISAEDDIGIHMNGNDIKTSSIFIERLS